MTVTTDLGATEVGRTVTVEQEKGRIQKGEKDGADVVVGEEEAQTVTTREEEAEKGGQYSRLSVWLMVLYSALAIGSDGYNAAVIGNVELLLAVLYPTTLTNSIYSRLSNAFLIGMIIGMLLFGGIVDHFGRKTGAVATTLLLVLGIALSAGASGHPDSRLFWMLIVARGIAGVGAGGEYPVSGAGATEASDEDGAYRKHRGFMFAIIADLSASLGYVWGGLVPLLLLLCTGQQVDKYPIVWRTSFSLGLVPPLSIFWFRLRMSVSTAYRTSSMRRQRVPYLLAVKRYWRALLGCSATWFMYNFVSVPFGIFSSTITSRVNAGDSLVKNLGWGVVINCFYIPGPFLGGYLSDRIGRRQTMCLGFALQACFGFVLGGASKPIQTVFPLFVVMYGLFLTLGEVGPGSTVLLTASECFPTSIRGQMMGFVAAWSKVGATLGTQSFTAIQSSWSDGQKSDQATFLIGSSFALLGALIAWFVIPDVSARLEDEDAAWKKYLEDNGWVAEWGDRETRDPKGVVMDRVAS
ncbi:metabolite transport protein [Phyllosticta citrichinensis]|uniref:Metabolite transport protein n=1 Tax=Phyllosticta citrichinensis TaxID=1130410 RepID=A0ABR1Y0D4_9PEZI